MVSLGVGKGFLSFPPGFALLSLARLCVAVAVRSTCRFWGRNRGVVLASRVKEKEMVMWIILLGKVELRYEEPIKIH